MGDVRMVADVRMLSKVIGDDALTSTRASQCNHWRTHLFNKWPRAPSRCPTTHRLLGTVRAMVPVPQIALRWDFIIAKRHRSVNLCRQYIACNKQKVQLCL